LPQGGIRNEADHSDHPGPDGSDLGRVPDRLQRRQHHHPQPRQQPRGDDRPDPHRGAQPDLRRYGPGQGGQGPAGPELQERARHRLGQQDH